MPPPLGQSVVVITGASSGIGRAAAHAFAARGARLVLASRNEEALREVRRECEGLGAPALAVIADMCNEYDVEALKEKALARFGRIDVWVNNAAVTLFGRIEEAPWPAAEKVLRTNLFGYFLGARAAIPVFRNQNAGVLINVSSVAGRIGQPLTSAYVASKWAIMGLTESLRQEVLDAQDIHVCALIPASVDTPLFQHGANFSGREPQPMKPIYRPQRVAARIVALAEKPRREASVGLTPWLTIAAHSLAPGLTERAVARRVERDHFAPRPADLSAGNLFRPGHDALQGGWRERRQGNARLRRGLTLAAVVVVPLLAMAWRQARLER